VNENSTSSIGIVGAIGFLALLVLVIGARERTDERLVFLSILTISFVVFCTVGGMSSMFAIIVSPMIRAWNRASVFVGFFSIAAALLLVQQALSRVAGSAARIAAPAAALALFAIGMFDQTTPACVACSAGEAAAYTADGAFVASVEKAVPPNSMIYQLPYMAFPEMPPINRLGSYDEAVGFLHSKTLRWSFGGMKGRQGDLFYRALAQQPIEQQIDTVRRMGFAGIWIDRRGYEDDGKALAENITEKLGHGPTVTSANQFFFAF
jgi:phosphoglycerol transferase